MLDENFLDRMVEHMFDYEQYVQRLITSVSESKSSVERAYEVKSKDLQLVDDQLKAAEDKGLKIELGFHEKAQVNQSKRDLQSLSEKYESYEVALLDLESVHTEIKSDLEIIKTLRKAARDGQLHYYLSDSEA